MLTRLVYLWYRNRRVQRFLAGMRRTREIQRELLFEKLRRNADSDFGRDHGFDRIRSVEDFRKQVPLATYEYYRPYVERVKRGELKAMFGPGTRLLMFALTSGTTDKAKFIPITQEFFDEYRDGWNMWGVRTYIDHLDLCSKKSLQLTSDWRQFLTEGGTPCGNISGLAAESAPLISRTVFLLPKWLCRIADTPSKQYTALRLALRSRRVGMIVTANPSTLVEFAKLADSQRERLIRDIHDGTLSDHVEAPAQVRELLGSRIRRADPQRAHELEEIIERTGTFLPRDYWPMMSVLAVWTGGSVGAYLPRLKEHFGETAFRDHGLSASEGRMTLPFADGTSAGPLDYVTHYFEFIPEEEHGSPDPTVLEAHELTPDRNYFIVLTTSSGLYRYDIRDVVRCVGYEGTTPLLEFLNKGSYFSSITGEKVSEFQAVTAVKAAFAELDIPIEQFTFAPTWGDPPGYVLLLESGGEYAHQAQLARRVDEHLARINCEYANRLETGRLRPLCVQEVPPGTWSAIREERVSRLGGSLEQYKHPYLVHDLQFIEGLLSRLSSSH